MTTSRIAVAAALLVLAAAGCSSSDDTPSPGDLAASIQAQATSPAADPGSTGSGSGSCGDAPFAAKAALTGSNYTDVSMVDECTVKVVTELTEPEVAKGLCDNVAGEVWQLGVKSIVVVGTDATQLASARSGAPCTAG